MEFERQPKDLCPNLLMSWRSKEQSIDISFGKTNIGNYHLEVKQHNLN